MKGMPASRLLGLAWRQLLRDLRASEVRVLFFSLLVAVADQYCHRVFWRTAQRCHAIARQ